MKPKVSQTFSYWIDPSHGWIQVPEQMLHELGIATQITSYSYKGKECVYLEEDVDMQTFFKAYKSKHGLNPCLLEHQLEDFAFIRKLPSYEH